MDKSSVILDIKEDISVCTDVEVEPSEDEALFCRDKFNRGIRGKLYRFYCVYSQGGVVVVGRRRGNTIYNSISMVIRSRWMVTILRSLVSSEDGGEVDV